jgi:uncharacterized phage-associated protein
MLAPFSALKTIQAAGVLLKQAEARRMSRLRLIKLLYIADRACIAETGRPITGDSVAAMDHGPVLSRTYDCIKGTDFAASEWDRYVRRSGFDVELADDPGNGKLSRYEIETLQKVAAEFAAIEDWDLAEHTHRFEEWRRNRPEPGASHAIPARHILEAVGLADQADQILAEAQARRAVRKLLHT